MQAMIMPEQGELTRQESKWLESPATWLIFPDAACRLRGIASTP